MTIGPMSRRCRAHNRLGEPCGSAPIHGGVVCVTHGGRAPQVKAAAAKRWGDIRDPAIDTIEHLMRHGENESVRLAAAKEIIDRVEGKSKERIEATLLSAFTLRIDRGDDNNDNNDGQ